MLAGGEPSAPTVPELLAALNSPSEEVREDSLAVLAEWVNESFDASGEALGQVVRDNDGVAQLALLLMDPNQTLRQQALLILGNLSSDSVDSKSALTKAALLRSGAQRAIFANLGSADSQTLGLACATLQNLCHDPVWSGVAAQHGIVPQLEQLASHADPFVVRYASGALRNILATQKRTDALKVSEEAAEAIRRRHHEAKVEEFRTRVAARRISRAVLRISPDIRLRRMLAHTDARFASAQDEAVQSRHTELQELRGRMQTTRSRLSFASAVSKPVKAVPALPTEPAMAKVDVAEQMRKSEKSIGIVSLFGQKGRGAAEEDEDAEEDEEEEATAGAGLRRMQTARKRLFVPKISRAEHEEVAAAEAAVEEAEARERLQSARKRLALLSKPGGAATDEALEAAADEEAEAHERLQTARQRLALLSTPLEMAAAEAAEEEEDVFSIGTEGAQRLEPPAGRRHDYVRAAILLQARHRGRRARAERARRARQRATATAESLRGDADERRRAAQALQKCLQRKLLRRRVEKARRLRAAIRIQALARGFICRRRVASYRRRRAAETAARRRAARRQRAAIRIQAYARGLICRQFVASYRRQRAAEAASRRRTKEAASRRQRAAVRIIQAYARRLMCQRREAAYRYQFRVATAAATLIQAQRRGKATRWRVANYRLHVTAAAKLVQTAVRGRAARRQVAIFRIVHKSAYRALKKGVRERRLRLARRPENAAVCLQAAVRRRRRYLEKLRQTLEERRLARERAKLEAGVDDLLSGIFVEKKPSRQPNTRQEGSPTRIRRKEGLPIRTRPDAVTPEALLDENGAAIPLASCRSLPPAPRDSPGGASLPPRDSHGGVSSLPNGVSSLPHKANGVLLGQTYQHVAGSLPDDAAAFGSAVRGGAMSREERMDAMYRWQKPIGAAQWATGKDAAYHRSPEKDTHFTVKPAVMPTPRAALFNGLTFDGDEDLVAEPDDARKGRDNVAAATAATPRSAQRARPSPSAGRAVARTPRAPNTPRSAAPASAASGPRRRELEDRVKQLEAELGQAQQKLRTSPHTTPTADDASKPSPPERRRPSPQVYVRANGNQPYDSYVARRGGPTEGTLLPPLAPSTPPSQTARNRTYDEFSWERYR